MNKDLEFIRQLVINETGFDPKTKRNKRSIVDARKIFILVAFQQVKEATDTGVGIFLGFNHSNINHHKNNSYHLVESDKQFKEHFLNISNKYFSYSKEITLEKLDSEITLLKNRIENLHYKRLEILNVHS